MINFTLTREQLVEIQQAMKHAPEPEVRQRATAVHLLHKGHGPEQVGEMMAVKLGTVYQWQRRWREGGIAALANRPRSGRPAKADENYHQILEEILEKEPAEIGYVFAIWTVDRLRAHMEEQTGIRLSAARLRALMKKQGYVYRQPKHDLSDLQDPPAREAARELLDWLKKSPSEEISNSSLWTKLL